MIKLMIKFINILVLTNSLLWTTAFAQTAAGDAAKLDAAAAAAAATTTVHNTTGVSRDALTSGNTLEVGAAVHSVTTEQINVANGNIPNAQTAAAQALAAMNAAQTLLDQKEALYQAAESGVNQALIDRRTSELNAALANCPGYDPLNGFGSCSGQNAADISTAQTNLTQAQLRNNDPGLIAQTKAERDQAKTDLIAATHENQYGMQTEAGANALKAAAQEIDNSIIRELAKPAGGVIDVINTAATTNNLTDQFGGRSGYGLSLYGDQLKRDITMLIIGQVTSRLSACTQVPDLKLGIGAGQAFIVGEVAEYAQAEYLKGQLKEAISRTQGNLEHKQLEYFETLLTEYKQVLDSSLAKKEFRTLSKVAFKNAAALAAAEAVEDETFHTACENSNINMTSRGSNKAGDEWAICIAEDLACSALFTGALACHLALVPCLNDAPASQNSCNSGFAATKQKLIDRKLACDQLGDESMITSTITASKTIRDRCVADGDAVALSAGTGCSGYSSPGAGPYSMCDKASDAYKRNMAACPVSVLTAAPAATLESSGVALPKDASYVARASEKVSRALDIRMASPRHRVIVWSAFSDLADQAIQDNVLMINEIKKQMAKIQSIIDELNKSANGVTLANNTSTTLKNPTLNLLKPTTFKFKAATTCLTGVTGACAPVSDSMAGLSGFNNFSGALKDSTNGVTKGLDVISNTQSITAAGMSSILGANNRASAIDKELAKKTSLLQSLLKKSGDKTDLKKDSLSFSNDFKKSVTKITNISTDSDSSSKLASLSSNGKEDAAGLANSTMKANKLLNPGTGTAGLLSAIGNISDQKKSDESKTDDSSKSDKLKDGGIDPNSEEGRRIAEAIEARNKTNKSKYSSSEDDGLFDKISKAYVRNFDKILVKRAKIIPESN